MGWFGGFSVPTQFVIPGQHIYTEELRLLLRLWVHRSWRGGNLNSGHCGEVPWRKEDRVWGRGDVTVLCPSLVSS